MHALELASTHKTPQRALKSLRDMHEHLQATFPFATRSIYDLGKVETILQHWATWKK